MEVYVILIIAVFAALTWVFYSKLRKRLEEEEKELKEQAAKLQVNKYAMDDAESPAKTTNKSRYRKPPAKEKRNDK